MDIRSGLDGLKTLLGVTPSAPATTERVAGGQTAGASGLGADSATLSSAGSEVSLTAAEGGLRRAVFGGSGEGDRQHAGPVSPGDGPGVIGATHVK